MMCFYSNFIYYKVAVNDFLNLSGEIFSEDKSMAKSLQNEKWLIKCCAYQW